MTTRILTLCIMLAIAGCRNNDVKVKEVESRMAELYKISQERNSRQQTLLQADPNATKGMIAVNGVKQFNDEYLITLSHKDSALMRVAIDHNVLQKEIEVSKSGLLRTINGIDANSQLVFSKRLDSLLAVIDNSTPIK